MSKICKILLSILAIIVLLALIFFTVDYLKVKKGEKPIFCIKTAILNDGGTTEYLGLGYKVIDFHTLAGFDDIKIGNWFIKYDDFNSEIKKYELEVEQNRKSYYSKTIDKTQIELDIPSGWNYEEVPRDEENDFYKYALKLYKNNKEQCAMLYFYNDKLGVCGTGRTIENITLNNGNKATIGYYDGNKNWNDISFYDTNEYIAVMNHGLVDTDANEAVELIKTINIISK